MRATADAKEFSNALSKVSRVASKSLISALEGVFLQFDGEHCTLTATDLEVWLSVTIPAHGDAFSCILGQIKQAVRSCRCLDGELVLELVESRNRGKEPDWLSLSCGHRSGTFTAMPAEEFPNIPELGDEVLFQTAADVLLARINRVRYATAKHKEGASELRSSIQFVRDHIYAVDGYRLACDTDAAISVSSPLISQAAFLANLRYLEGQQIEARRGTRWLQFIGENTRLDCRLTESIPLELDQTVPTRFREEFYVCPGEFLRELNYLKNLLPPKVPPLVRFDGGVLSLEKWPGCRTKITVDLTESQSCTIAFGFDLSYMLDAIGQFEDAPNVKMKISGSFGPVILEAEGRSDFALVMPVRLQEQRAAA